MQESAELLHWLRQLPDIPASAYDGLIVSPDHIQRLQKVWIENGGTGPAPKQYAGISIVGGPMVPDGYAVMTQRGAPVGILNLAEGRATMIRPKTLRQGQRE